MSAEGDVGVESTPARSPVMVVADLLSKHTPDRMEEAYFRMEYAAAIAKHSVETASIAFNSYVIPGYANRDSVPLLMAAALLTVWPEGAETSRLHLVDTLPYMDADTISHLANSVNQPSDDLGLATSGGDHHLGVYKNPHQILMGSIQVSKLRQLVADRSADAIIEWLLTSETSLSTHTVAKEALGMRVLTLTSSHPRVDVVHSWLDDDIKDE